MKCPVCGAEAADVACVKTTVWTGGRMTTYVCRKCATQIVKSEPASFSFAITSLHATPIYMASTGGAG